METNGDEERPRGNRVGRNYPPETQRKEQEMTTKWNVRRSVLLGNLSGEREFSALFSGFSLYMSILRAFPRAIPGAVPIKVLSGISKRAGL
jgi:hypothetical protein